MHFPLEVYDAVRAVFPNDKPIGVRVSATDWVEGGWIAHKRSNFQRIEATQRRLIDVSSGGVSPCKRSPSVRLPGAAGAGREGGNGAHDNGVGLITEPVQAEESWPPARPTWSRWPAACSTTRAGAGTPRPSFTAR